jgi:hypothetical protein
MAGSMSLAYSGTTITLSPLSSAPPDHTVDVGAIVKKGIFGALFTYLTLPEKVNHYLEFNNVSKADADNLNTWCLNKYVLTYTPDTATAGTTYQVKLINEGNPFSWMANLAADSVFSGSLQIREV